MAIKARINRLENCLLDSGYDDRIEVWANLFMEVRILSDEKPNKIIEEDIECARHFLSTCSRLGLKPGFVMLNRLADEINHRRIIRLL